MGFGRLKFALILLFGFVLWPQSNASAQETSIADRLKKKQDESALEPNARKIALREYGKHVLDKEKPEPENVQVDKWAIGRKSQTGEPGPVNSQSEDYLKKKEPIDDKPANSGPPNKKPDNGDLKPPPDANTVPIIAPPLMICFPASDSQSGSGSGSSGGSTGGSSGGCTT